MINLEQQHLLHSMQNYKTVIRQAVIVPCEWISLYDKSGSQNVRVLHDGAEQIKKCVICSFVSRVSESHTPCIGSSSYANE